MTFGGAQLTWMVAEQGGDHSWGCAAFSCLGELNAKLGVGQSTCQARAVPPAQSGTSVCQRWINGEEETCFGLLQTTAGPTSLHTLYNKNTRATFSLHPSHPPEDTGIPALPEPHHFQLPTLAIAGKLSCGAVCLSHINSFSSKPVFVDIRITCRYHRLLFRVLQGLL